MLDVGERPRPAVSRSVFEQLLDLALSAKPGEKLPTQRALAAELGVTVGALRESLKRLEQLGLIDVRHGDAMRVRDWRRHGGPELLAPLLAAGRLGPRLLGDVLEARSLMLGEMGALAAGRRSPEQVHELMRLADALADVRDDAEARELDFAFVEALADAAGNLVFGLILNSIRPLYFEHADRLPVTADHAELAPLYREAATAIGRSHPEAARKALAHLAQRQRERVEATLA